MGYKLSVFETLVSMRSNFADIIDFKKRLNKAIDEQAQAHEGYLDLSLETLIAETSYSNAPMNRFLPEDIEYLLKALKKNTSVKRLDLRGHNIGDKGATLLLNLLKVNLRIRTLYIKDNNIGADNISALHKTLEENRIKRLSQVQESFDYSGIWQGIAIGSFWAFSGLFPWKAFIPIAAGGVFLGWAKEAMKFPDLVDVDQIYEDDTDIDIPDPAVMKLTK